MTGFACSSASLRTGSARSGAGRAGGDAEARVPFIFFFDGFRTSHEDNTIDAHPDEQIRAMIDDELVRAHRARALSPEHPVAARHRAQSRHLFPGPRGGQPLLRQGPRHRAEGDGSPGRTDRASIRLFRYAGHPRRRACRRRHRLGRGVLDETAAWLDRPMPARRSAYCRSRSIGRGTATHFSPPCPRPSRRSPCWIAPRRSGRPGEPLYVDVISTYARAGSAGKIARRCRRSSAAATAFRRRISIRRWRRRCSTS